MFYNKYLDEFYLGELLENYDLNYLKNIDQDNFESVYQMFKKYKVEFIEDIILGYLDVFTLKVDVVEEKWLKLKMVLGDNYLDLIGDDLSYLEYLVK